MTSNNDLIILVFKETFQSPWSSYFCIEIIFFQKKNHVEGHENTLYVGKFYLLKTHYFWSYRLLFALTSHFKTSPIYLLCSNFFLKFNPPSSLLFSSLSYFCQSRLSFKISKLFSESCSNDCPSLSSLPTPLPLIASNTTLCL